MKVFRQVGSKDRLVEMFQNVNKIKLNEAFGQTLNPQSVLEEAFAELKNGTLKINHSNTQTNNNESYVELMGIDKQGNNITFTFKAIVEEGEQDGVFDVTEVGLEQFSFDSTSTEESVELAGDTLKQFNMQHQSELFDVVDEYIDVEEEESIDSLYEDATKLIDKIPYKSGSERMQTQKAYADEKPTNPKLRVDSKELDKTVNEEYPEQLGKEFKPKQQTEYSKVTKSKKKHKSKKVEISESTDRDKYENVVFLQGDEAFDALERLDLGGKDAALNYLKQWHYPGEHEGTNELGHGTSDQTYEKDGYIMSWNSRLGYIGLQYDLSKLQEEYETGEEEIEIDSPEIPMDKAAEKQARGDVFRYYQKQPRKVDIRGKQDPAEFGPKTVPYDADFRFDENEEPVSDAGGSGNLSIGDVVTVEGLGGAYQIAISHSEGKPFLIPFNMAEKKGNIQHKIYLTSLNNPKFTKIMSFSDTRGGFMGEEENKDDGMSFEPKGDELEQIAQEKEKAGDLLQGGKSDNKSPLEFDPDQVIMGLDVEKEHTDNPLVAVEIATDHLSELPDYYTRLNKMEKNAKKGMKESDEEDLEMTDRLLGYKPKNVGDTMDEEIGMADYKGQIGDKYADAEGNEFAVSNKVKGGVSLKGQGGEKEVATGDLDLMKKLNEMGAAGSKTKAFKLGEWAKGGIIKVDIKGTVIVITALDWNTKKPIESNSFESTNTLGIDNFLNELTTSYYAGKIMEWIEANGGGGSQSSFGW